MAVKEEVVKLNLKTISKAHLLTAMMMIMMAKGWLNDGICKTLQAAADRLILFVSNIFHFFRSTIIY